MKIKVITSNNPSEFEKKINNAITEIENGTKYKLSDVKYSCASFGCKDSMKIMYTALIEYTDWSM